MEKYQLFINGKWQNPDSNEWFESQNPYTNQPWALIPRSNSNVIYDYLQEKSVFISLEESTANPFILK